MIKDLKPKDEFISGKIHLICNQEVMIDADLSH